MPNSSFSLSNLNGSNGFVLNGINADDHLGRSVSGAGDINGDGIDDLIIGAPGNFYDYSAGKTYVVFGGTDVGVIGSFDLSSLDGSNGFVLNGTMEGESLGISVSDAGDINGDGFDDLIIGVHGPYFVPAGSEKNYVVFGSPNVGAGGSIDLSNLNGSNGFVLNADGSGSRDYSVSGAGDINGDGFDDLIIGVPGAYFYGSYGASYVVFGGSTLGASGNFKLASLNGDNGFRIQGIQSGDAIGDSVSNAGDINGDGFADLIIGASWVDSNGFNSGASYVVFGGTNTGSTGSLNLSTLDSSNGFVVNGINQQDRLGSSVSSAGDINSDGFDDLIIGAPSADANGNLSGASYVVLGGTNVGVSGSIDLSTLDGSNGFVINGITVGDGLGSSVSAAGDMNNDGFDDLIIGAPSADPNGSPSGASYVVLGGTNVGESGSIDLSTLDGSNGFVINGITVGDGLGSSVSAAGDMNNDGFDDLIIGAPSADPNGSFSGASYVVFGNATLTFDPIAIINGTPGNDRLFGTPGKDAINGSSGRDWIWGGLGDDLLNGGNSSDRLVGGFGDDTLTGGAGRDRFVLRAGQGTDRIVDFQDGQDSIMLTGGLTFEQLTITSNPGNALLTDISLVNSGEVLVTLSGSVRIDQITAADFITL
jgi:hypothetical protein